jgi:hypothetical protein
MSNIAYINTRYWLKGHRDYGPAWMDGKGASSYNRRGRYTREDGELVLSTRSEDRIKFKRCRARLQ